MIMAMSEMYPERPMTIKGNVVHLHACELRPKEEKYDYSQQVAIIESVIKNMFSVSNIVPVYIQGQTGSGKTVLANVLKENGINVEIIDVIRLKESGVNNPSKLITDFNKTYIVDEAGYGDMEIVSRAEEHTKNDGVIILFLQDIRHLGKEILEFEAKPKYLHLERGNLSEISL